MNENQTLNQWKTSGIDLFPTISLEETDGGLNHLYSVWSSSLSTPLEIIKSSSCQLLNYKTQKARINKILFPLLQIYTNLNIFKEFMNFYQITPNNVSSILPYFTYKCFNKGNLIYSQTTKVEDRFLYFIICGKVQTKRYQCGEYLTKLISKIQKLRLESEICIILNIQNIDILVNKTLIEDSEYIIDVIDKIKSNSNLEKSKKAVLLSEAYIPPKYLFYSKPGDYFGLNEIVADYRRLEEVSSAVVLSDVLHCFAVDKDHLCKYWLRNIINSLSEKYSYISICLCKSNKFNDEYKMKLLIRKTRVVFPCYGECIYKENERGEYFYLIYQGSCLGKKAIYFNINNAPSTVKIPEKIAYNYRLENKHKEITEIICNEGSFCGVEILYNINKQYKYTLQVNTHDTILLLFDIDEFKLEELKTIKQSIQESNQCQEEQLGNLQECIVKNDFIPEYRNILQSELKNKTMYDSLEVSITEREISKPKYKTIHINAELKNKDGIKKINRSISCTNSLIQRWTKDRVNILNMKGIIEDKHKGNQPNLNQGINDSKLSSFFISQIKNPSSGRGELPSSRDSQPLKERNKNVISQMEKINILRLKQLKTRGNIFSLLNSKTTTADTNRLIKNLSLNSLEKPGIRLFKNYAQSERQYSTLSYNIPLICSQNKKK